MWWLRRRKQQKIEFIDPENESYFKGLMLVGSMPTTPILDKALDEFFSEEKPQGNETEVKGNPLC